MPRRFVFGDIHGCSRALESLLENLPLRDGDELILLGDVVDRGPATRRVLDTLLGLEPRCRLTFIRGNHEEMLLRALGEGEPGQVSFWLRHGGEATLASYGGSLGNVPEGHRDLLNRSIPYLETPCEILIHANLEPGVELAEQSGEWLRWQHLTGMEFPHPSGKRVICGHSGVGTELPLLQSGWLCLDTLVHRGGYLTCLDIDTGELFQASQSGEYRCGIGLDDLA